MKKIIIGVLALTLLLSACSKNENGENTSALVSSISSKTESKGDLSSTNQVLFDPHELVGMSYSDFINQYSDSVVEQGIFEGSYSLFLNNDICVMLNPISSDGIESSFVSGFWINSKFDLYKGISVGKTVEEINKGLDKKFVVEPNDEDVGYLSVGRYVYNGKKMVIYIFFEENHVVNRILLCYNKYDYNTFQEIG